MENSNNPKRDNFFQFRERTSLSIFVKNARFRFFIFFIFTRDLLYFVTDITDLFNFFHVFLLWLCIENIQKPVIKRSKTCFYLL